MGFETTGPGVLSGSYPCDPWLEGSESTKAFFLPRIGSGWGVDGIRDNRCGAPGFYPDRIRVIRG